MAEGWRVWSAWRTSSVRTRIDMCTLRFSWSSYGVAEVYWMTEALALRLGAVAIDLTLWRVLTSRTLVSYLDDHRSLAQELTT